MTKRVHKRKTPIGKRTKFGIEIEERGKEIHNPRRASKSSPANNVEK